MVGGDGAPEERPGSPESPSCSTRGVEREGEGIPRLLGHVAFPGTWPPAFWGPSPLPGAEPRLGLGGPCFLVLLQVSTLKGQLQQELRRRSASFSPPSGPPEN